MSTPASDEPFDAIDFLKTAPQKPGVYVMRNQAGVILYVGKAKNLKNRLGSYFRGGAKANKIHQLVRQVARVEVTVTQSENEALLLESNFIKTYKPRYNVLLKDDKSYPYLHLSAHASPRLSFYRGVRRASGRYFGPYPSTTAVRETLELMKKIFKVRQCEDVFFAHRSRPCLQFQIDRCTAPCTGEIDHEAYQRDVLAMSRFLEGKSQYVIEDLVHEMQRAAEQLYFEQAARLRDQIQQLRQIQSKQSVEVGNANVDVIAVQLAGGVAALQMLFIRDGRMLGSRSFFPKLPHIVLVQAEDAQHNKDQQTSDSALETEVISSFIGQFYDDDHPCPAEILVSHIPDEIDWLTSYLTERAARKVTICHKLRGDRAKWLALAQRNAEQALSIKLAGAAGIAQRLLALQQALHREQPILRIECFDISHTFGERTVASNVVFGVDGLQKNAYRRFNIDGITEGDDYAAMHQALSRRFKRAMAEETVLPDILLIDGGRGQLSQAQAVLSELQITDIQLIGVAKGEGRKAGLETLWCDGKPLPISTDSPGFHLVLQVRDEAHRFAIEGHRSRREKARRRSVLEDIAGIGEKRRNALLAQFGGLQSLKKASAEDMTAVSGISRSLAEKIVQALRAEQ